MFYGSWLFISSSVRGESTIQIQGYIATSPSVGYRHGARRSVPKVGSGDTANTRTLVIRKIRNSRRERCIIHRGQSPHQVNRLDVDFAVFFGVRIGVAKVRDKEISNSRPLPFLIQSEVVALSAPLLFGLLVPWESLTDPRNASTKQRPWDLYKSIKPLT